VKYLNTIIFASSVTLSTSVFCDALLKFLLISVGNHTTGVTVRLYI